jgi:ABC-type phosphate/phosphonate transport system substrate-binding protein
MSAIASLGMYDTPALHAANDQFWQAIAWRLRASGVSDVPASLNRDRPLDAIWNDPNLLLAQTCGYPLMTRLRGRLQYVATPRYTAIGCEGTDHRSRVVVRKDDPAKSIGDRRGSRLAINDHQSNTGMNLLRALIAPLAQEGRFFGEVLETGSHFASARAVAAEEADIAAIDCVTFALFEREEPDVASALRTLAWTASSPGLPIVTASAASDGLVRLLRTAIRDAMDDEPEAAGQLLLDGIENIGERRYQALVRLKALCRRLGYSTLR